MNGFPSRSLRTILLGLLVASAFGCAGKTYKVGKTTIWPIGGPVTDEVPGVTPPQVRMQQLRQLAKTAPSSTPEQREKISTDLAQQLSNESDPLIRVELVRTLAKCHTGTATAALRTALEDSDTDVRQTACAAWGEQGGQESTTVLSEVLGRDSDFDVRLAAARALGQTRDRAAVAALGLALEDPDPAMQARAVNSLREVTGNDMGNDVEKWRQYVKGEVPQDQPVSFAERLRLPF